MTKLDQATQLIEQADTTGVTNTKARRLLKHAKVLLRSAEAAAKKATKGKHPKLTQDCATSIQKASKTIRGGLGV